MPAQDADDHAPRRLSAPERRELVVAAALDLFAEQGYRASMGDVAAAAGITRTVLYHYFPSKERLFVSVLETQAGALVRHLAPAVSGDGSQAQRARAMIAALVEFVEESPRSWEILFHHRDDAEPAVAVARARIHQRVRLTIAVLLASDMTAAGIDADSTRGLLLGEMVLGAMVAAGRWWREHPEVSRDEVVDAAFDLLWHGSSGLSAGSGDPPARRARGTRR